MYRGSNNALRYWDVWADGVTNLTAAVEAFNNRNNVSLPGTAVIVTRAMSKFIINDISPLLLICAQGACYNFTSSHLQVVVVDVDIFSLSSEFHCSTSP